MMPPPPDIPATPDRGPTPADDGPDEAALAPADAALVAATTDDESAPFDLDGLATEVGATRALLDAVARAGLLLPHHVDVDGVARYSAADADAVRAGLTLLDAGLPLGELLDLARRTDGAIRVVADHAVEAFLRFVRDPVHGTAGSDDEASERLVTAYESMLPATERLVAHHLRRRLIAAAAERIAAGSLSSDPEPAAETPPGPNDAAGPPGTTKDRGADESGGAGA